MTDRAHLVAKRGGRRGVATRIIARLNAANDNPALDPPHRIYELESKLAEIRARSTDITDLDQQIYNETDTEPLEDKIDATDQVNSVIQNAQDQFQYIINCLKRDEEAVNPIMIPLLAPVVSTRSTSRPKITFPKFEGHILQWQPFWQAFEAEIDTDVSLENIKKFNYLVGQLEPNVLITVVGLTSSNDNYPVLVALLNE